MLSLWKGEIGAPVTMREIAERVAFRVGVSLEDLRGASRKRYIAHPRQEVFALIYATDRFSLPQIGRYFGGRDHTTILYGIREHEARLAGVTSARCLKRSQRILARAA